MADDWYTYLYDDDREMDLNDDYDQSDYDDYYQAWGWRYHLRNLHYQLYWWLRRHLRRCPNCKKRLCNCDCIPF